MTIANAIKKLEKAGFAVKNPYCNIFNAIKEGCKYAIQFHKNGREDYVTCIRVKHHDDEDNSMADYCAGYFVDNIAQAIKGATR